MNELIDIVHLIGITSFLLIGYWWDRSAANNAASQALIVNRLGDWSFTLGIILILTLLGTLDLESIIMIISHLVGDISYLIKIEETIGLEGYNLVSIQNQNMLSLLLRWSGLFLVIAAFGKSAQFLLHTWLPMSMEGWNNPLKPTLFFLFFTSYSTSNKVKPLNTMIRNQKGQFVKKQKDPIFISNEIKEAITGDLLGDGSLRISTPKNKNMPYGSANLAFTFSIANYPLLHYLRYKVYSSICSETPPNPYPNINLPQHLGKKVTQYTFRTRSLEELGEIRNNWYNEKNIRILPKNIESLLTFRSIAHWIMGDGFHYKGYINFCTDNFTKEEVEILVSILSSKFGWKSTLTRRISTPSGKVCWRIRISKLSRDNLIEKILPYMIPEMYYKLGIES